MHIMSCLFLEKGHTSNPIGWRNARHKCRRKASLLGKLFLNRVGRKGQDIRCCCYVGDGGGGVGMWHT